MDTLETIIFTSAPEFAQLGWNEIQKLDRGAKLVRSLDAGIRVVQLETESFQSLSSKIRETKTVFVRHIFPVFDEFPLDNTAKLDRFIDQHLNSLNSAQPVSIQTRFVDAVDSSIKTEFRQHISNRLIEAGFTVEVKDPTQIISIVCAANLIYIGISSAEQNLSTWAGGMHRFAHENEQISRSEFKLLEAIDVFNLTFPNAGLALDLGASPGGWTRILRKFGLSVVAVDPGDLSEKLAFDRGVVHRRQTVQQFLPMRDLREISATADRFDVIVNDMRMNAIESAKNMRLASETLSETGFAVMTLKLPNQGVQKTITRAIAVLESAYEIIGVRNLFHNRQEATIALKLRKSS